MAYVEYHSNGLKLFSLNDTNMFPSKILSQKLSLGSVLRPLLFLIYINRLHQVTKHAEIHYFADDTNLLYSSKSLKDINQKINFVLKNIAALVRTIKISLNTKKTETVPFRSQKTIIQTIKKIFRDDIG